MPCTGRCPPVLCRDPSNEDKHDYSLVGTPHNMSPELLSSHKYGFETDVWSLGCVFYELSTLKPPFNAFNLAGLIAKIKRAALPPIGNGYSPEWAALIKRCVRAVRADGWLGTWWVGVPCLTVLRTSANMKVH